MAACRKKATISVAGGINEETVAGYAALKPEILIIGSGICHAKDPLKAAKVIRNRMDGWAHGCGCDCAYEAS